MTEPETRGGRPRRRAMRQVGPPAEGVEQSAPSRVARAEAVGGNETTVVAGEAKVESAVSESLDAEAALPASTDSSSAVLGSAGDGPVDAPVAEGEPGPSGGADATVKLETSPAAGAKERDDSEAELWKPATAGSAEPPTGSVEQSDRPAGKLGWLGWTAAAVAAVSALVLIGSGGILIYHQRHVDALQQQRADYTQTAKQVVLNLTNISGDTAPKDIDRVLSVASGQLKQEYSDRKDAYAQVVRQAKVKASGQIIEAAVESEDDHTAQVLVAAAQTLTNAGSPDPQQRYYRFRVTVTRDDDGHLTGSQVEFVA